MTSLTMVFKEVQENTLKSFDTQHTAQEQITGT